MRYELEEKIYLRNFALKRRRKIWAEEPRDMDSMHITS